MTWFQRLLLITIAATFVLVVIGGTVRATDSGLGCPDWPTCHGRLIPSADKHTIIEYSHRTAATVVGVLFLGVTFFTFKTERRNKLVFWLAFSAGVVLLAQIILGGVTVKKELPAEIVAAHLATAMAFMGILIATATISIMRARGLYHRGHLRYHPGHLRRAAAGVADTNFNRMAMLTAAVAFLTLVLGSYISGTDASLACSGWPLCNGSLVPGGGSAEGLHFLHRLVAGVLGIMLLGLIYLAFEERRRQPMLIALTLFAGVSYLAQAMLGAANIWTDLAAGVVVAHLSMAALLWCTLVLISSLAFYLPGENFEQDADAAADRVRGKEAAQWVR
jgi:heme A synthase